MQEPTLIRDHSPLEIRVRILLAGGHEHLFVVQREDPLLQTLFGILAARARRDEASFQGLFQIPLDYGRSALCFPCEHLVGLITEPPVTLQDGNGAVAPGTAAVAAQEGPGAQPEPIMPSRFVQLENFLTDEQHRRLLRFAQDQEKSFVSTTVFEGANAGTDYRQSRVLYSFPEFSDLVKGRIRALLPDLLRQLALEPFVLEDIESQLTTHNDGNYYRVHNDNGSPDSANRRLTYVYYFNRRPKAYSGGQLKLFDSRVEKGFIVQAESFQLVEPEDNSIVFFLSHCMHEVLPVSCPSRRFADGRFTINGWIRAAR